MGKKNEKKDDAKHGVPAILSFLWPGLGQIVKGDVSLGIVIMFGMMFSVMAMFVFVGFITTPILYAWQVYDAYNANY